MENMISKSQFKPRALHYFREIEKTGKELVISDHGKPVIPVSNSIAVKSVNLPQPPHSDPADRIIIATALSIGAPLVTKDKKISDYAPVKTIW